MADVNFRKALENAKNSWGQAKKRAETGGGFANEIEDGRYKATIKNAIVGLSKTSQRLQVAWTYEILEGDYAGKTKMDWDGLDSEDNQMWLGRKIARLGFDIPEDIEQVESILADIIKSKIKIRITVKTKGEFQKVYVDGLLSGDDSTEEDAGGVPAVEDVATEEEATVEVGQNVSFEYKGETLEGDITSILEEEGKVKVKSGKMIYTLKAEDISLVTPEPEPETEAEPEVEEVPEEPKKKLAPVKAKAKIVKKKK